MRRIAALLLIPVATIALAAAGQGLRWSATTTYADGSALEAGKKVVYLVFDSSNGKQVYSTASLTAGKDRLPADGCYYLMAAFANDAGTGIIEGSQSAPTDPKCTKTVPVQKRLATPAGFDVLP